MNILVTGGNGFIGRNLVQSLISRGDTVYSLDRNRQSDKHTKSVIYITTDISNSDILEADLQPYTQKIDRIVHLASYGVTEREYNLGQGIQTNISGTLNLLEYAYKNAISQFVNIGSCFEYAPSDESYSEEMPLDPQTMYGAIKASQTLLVRTFARTHDYNAPTLRLFTPFGPHEQPQRFIPTLITSALTDSKMIATNAGNVRDYVYVQDVIEAITSTLENNKLEPGEIINIGSGNQYSLAEVVEIVEQELQKPVPLSWSNTQDQRTVNYNNWRCNRQKALKLLSWEPRITLQEGIKRVIECYRKNHQ